MLVYITSENIFNTYAIVMSVSVDHGQTEISKNIQE